MLRQHRSIRAGIVCRATACFLVGVVAVALPVGASPIITPGAELVPVHVASQFFEGPTWHPVAGKLYFSSLTGNGQIYRLTPPTRVDLWMDDTQGINGTFLSLYGRLLCAQGDARKILSLGVGPDGPEDPVTLAEDASWTKPNDICQAPNGDIYFTTRNSSPPSNNVVYHLSPGGVVTPVVTDMSVCNGVITSLDGQTLYVSDSYEKLWRSYPILPDGGVGVGSVFFNPSAGNQDDPDGMTIDEFGNLYFTGRGGIWIVSPAGQELEMQPVTEFCANATFGGVDGKTLYITCDGKVYSLSMEVRGALWSDVPESNQRPQVDAGADQTVTTRAGVAQPDATVTDDGEPDPPAAVTTIWTKVSGPGDVPFGDASAVDTTVTFSETGVYVLQLLAFDGLRVAADEVTITFVRVADLDKDDDVDGEDFIIMEGCITGAELGPPSPGCALSDIDEDGDVDMTDFGFFQRCLSGPGVPSHPACAD